MKLPATIRDGIGDVLELTKRNTSATWLMGAAGMLNSLADDIRKEVAARRPAETGTRKTGNYRQERRNNCLLAAPDYDKNPAAELEPEGEGEES
jgi:hypothetical protein